MNRYDERFRGMLRANGHSITATRSMVFGAIKAHGPLTISDLVARCSGTDRASVYRSVQLFETLGIARRLYSGWKYKVELTDIFGHHHHHATCSICGRIIPLAEDEALEMALKHLAAQHGFALNGHEIELNGVCEQCRKQ